MSHETSNPFKKPSAFPALNFPFISEPFGNFGEELSLLDMHRHLIHPLDFNPRPNAKSDPLFDSPSSQDDSESN
jgi:hypothetical protein